MYAFDSTINESGPVVLTEGYQGRELIAGRDNLALAWPGSVVRIGLAFLLPNLFEHLVHTRPRQG